MSASGGASGGASGNSAAVGEEENTVDLNTFVSRSIKVK